MQRGDKLNNILMRSDITIRPETRRDYKDIISLVLPSFRGGMNYYDVTDIIALIEEVRD